ncbi:MAG: lipid-A-disaccharide synthase, partial [Prevotellaceae bacterium]|nr:lipid-A-disaccharide synthase [Prevotellaceae bacterium]
MKYYLIAGEPSGDLHASNLMKELKMLDSQAEFRYFGGDLMQAQGGTLVKHYREMAFMGFAAVIANFRTIFGNFSLAKKDISQHKPDVLILVDYPSFNLKIAKFVKKHFPGVSVYYYISPKIWAWKEYRMKDIKKYIDRLFSILPFEVDWFKKHDYAVTYVGNPSVDAIENRADKEQSFEEFVAENSLSGKPLVALLAGSRKQEIKACLPVFMQLLPHFPDCEFVVAGAPGIDAQFYGNIIGNHSLKVIYGKTYQLLQQSTAAIVNSGTASLETALLNTPQVVAYSLKGGKLATWIMRKVIKVKWASLVNLIANREVVKELMGADFTFENLRQETGKLLYSDDYRRQQ